MKADRDVSGTAFSAPNIKVIVLTIKAKATSREKEETKERKIKTN